LLEKMWAEANVQTMSFTFCTWAAGNDFLEIETPGLREVRPDENSSLFGLRGINSSVEFSNGIAKTSSTLSFGRGMT
jgi:hypothetical protein